MARLGVIFKRRLTAQLRRAIEEDVRHCNGVHDARFVRARPANLQVEYDQAAISPRALLEYVRQWEETAVPETGGAGVPAISDG